MTFAHHHGPELTPAMLPDDCFIATGTAIALAIAGGISAGSQVAGAKIASNAAKKASEIQVAAGDKALVLQKQQYDQTRADLSPWIQQGAQAYAQLGRNIGSDGSAPVGMPAPVHVATTPHENLSGFAPSSTAGAPSPGPAPAPPPIATNQPPSGSLASYAPPPSGPAPGGALVTLKAPNSSETRQFAANDPQIPLFMSRGAVRVG